MDGGEQRVFIFRHKMSKQFSLHVDVLIYINRVRLYSCGRKQVTRCYPSAWL